MAPNDQVGPIHDRMPVILDSEGAWALWLEGDRSDAMALCQSGDTPELSDSRVSRSTGVTYYYHSAGFQYLEDDMRMKTLWCIATLVTLSNALLAQGHIPVSEPSNQFDWYGLAAVIGALVCVPILWQWIERKFSIPILDVVIGNVREVGYKTTSTILNLQVGVDPLWWTLDPLSWTHPSISDTSDL